MGSCCSDRESHLCSVMTEGWVGQGWVGGTCVCVCSLASVVPDSL